MKSSLSTILTSAVLTARFWVLAIPVCLGCDGGNPSSGTADIGYDTLNLRTIRDIPPREVAQTSGADRYCDENGCTLGAVSAFAFDGQNAYVRDQVALWRYDGELWHMLVEEPTPYPPWAKREKVEANPVGGYLGALEFDDSGRLYDAMDGAFRRLENDTTWRAVESSRSLVPSHMIVTTMVWRARGELWAGGSRNWQGALIRKVQGDSLVAVYLPAGMPDIVSAATVSSLVEDSGGTLWVGFHNMSFWTYENSIGLVALSDTAVRVYNTSNSKLPSNNIRDITYDPAWGLAVSTDSGIVKMPSVDTMVATRSCTWGLNVYSIYYDRYGMLWVASEKGLARYRQEDKWDLYLLSGIGNPPTSYAVMEDNNDRLWVGGLYGLAVMTAQAVPR